jgi:Tol biopolymer transport system component
VRPLNASGSFSPDGRFLATTSLDSHGVDILNIATGERVRVFDQPGNWVWSPDSAQLAISVSESFVVEGSYPELNEGVFVANADGSGYRKIAHLREAFVSWSPRGDYIAATASAMAEAGTPGLPGPRRLLLLRPDGREQRTLLVGAAGVTWSPSGAELAFLRSEPGARSSSLMAVDVGSGSVRTIAEDVRLVGDLRLFGGLEWSPDGRAIVLTTIDREQDNPVFPDSTFEILIVMADGSAPPQRVANGRSPSWSPDGRYLAFVGDWCQPPNSPRFDLMVFDRETQQLETITPLNFDILLAQWSPTDDVIGFQRLDDASIYTARPDGSALRRIISLEAVSDEFLWTPDGGRLAYFAPGGFGICD